MGEALRVQSEAEGLCDQFEVAYEKALAGVGKQQEVLYLVWRDPWMTVSSDTYIAQTLALFGWRTLPVAATERDPGVDLPDFPGVDRVLLSSEPFHFKEQHVAEVEGLIPGAT